MRSWNDDDLTPHQYSADKVNIVDLYHAWQLSRDHYQGQAMRNQAIVSTQTSEQYADTGDRQ
ncbi:hypothetical protein AC579_105 [Pseudocercospora musae]|uniref:Uncharacterized protein n=1 Tax=Pseudocercospora musae TaxID=113226 RepID=A0A139IHF7_9PEZI|nr:hypothetical protein AC579_105 [Pseudocercospora musae]